MNQIAQDTKDKILENFPSLRAEVIEDVRQLYDKELVESIPYQYLAHMIRTMESYIQEKSKNEFFRITFTPYKSDNITQLACGQYHSDSFDIFYDERIDPRQIRTAIAHELGHLFFLFHKGIFENENNITEPLSSLFGIIIMLHKLEHNNKKDVHISDSQIISDMVLVTGKNKDYKL